MTRSSVAAVSTAWSPYRGNELETQSTRVSFDEQLNELQQELLRMGGAVEQMLFKCVKALSEQDSALADETIVLNPFIVSTEAS